MKGPKQSEIHRSAEEAVLQRKRRYAAQALSLRLLDLIPTTWEEERAFPLRLYRYEAARIVEERTGTTDEEALEAVEEIPELFPSHWLSLSSEGGETE